MFAIENHLRPACRLLACVVVALLAGCTLRQPEAPPPAARPVPEQPPLDNTRFPLEEGANVVGELQQIRTRKEDTFIDIALAYDLGYDELVEANPGIDPWLPGEGTTVVLPGRFILPDAPRQGIVLNVASKRLFYFPKPAKGAAPVVHTFPISIGREGWATPLGKTRVVSKKKDPSWRPPASIRKEHAENGDPLPAVVPPGPDNPLGRYAMRLALRGDYLIHGTNKPAGLGMRASHGCIRMNPGHIEWLYPQIPVGTPVHIVNQPVLVGSAGHHLYVEAHPALEEDKTRRTAELLRSIEKQLAKNGPQGSPVDYERVARIANDRRGMPLPVRTGSPDPDAAIAAARRVANVAVNDWFEDDTAGAADGEPAASDGKTAR